jgi:hypothetical protein
MTQKFVELLNEMQADFTNPIQKDVKGDPVLYKLSMTAANLHESLADLFAQKGMAGLSNRHHDLAMRMKADAQKFLN